jgi:hypothetical protein
MKEKAKVKQIPFATQHVQAHWLCVAKGGKTVSVDPNRSAIRPIKTSQGKQPILIAKTCFISVGTISDSKKNLLPNVLVEGLEGLGLSPKGNVLYRRLKIDFLNNYEFPPIMRYRASR